MPQVETAAADRNRLQASTDSLIKLLTWSDFEVLVDLVFSRLGWQRIGIIGGPQKTTDLELIQPLTGERAIVQVKASTTQQEFDSYAARFAELSVDKAFYVYHTSKLSVVCDEHKAVRLIGPQELSMHVLNAGLLQWLIDKVG